MTPVTLTALIGLGILLGTYILTIALYYRWWKVSQQAVIMALSKEDVTERQLNKMLKKIRLYAVAINKCRKLTMEIPILAPALLLIAVISWLVNL
jgi:hypothetical protein